jgi:predicted acylesterase/phospholipase RssA
MSAAKSFNSSLLSKPPLGRVAVSLQSSFLGFSTHAGFLNALLDSGIQPDKVSGSSSGALIASAYAGGFEQSQLKDFALSSKLKNSFWEWGSLLRIPFVFGAYLCGGVIRGTSAVKHLRKALPVALIENSPNAQLSIGVTNLTKMQRQIVARGEVAAYVVASCAVTPMIQAQKIDGELFIDGGFTDATPFEQWIDDPEIDTIIIHQIKFVPSVTSIWHKYTNFISYWAAAHQIIENEVTALRIARAEAAGKRVIVHMSSTARPKFFSSRKHFEKNYQTAYEGWASSAGKLLGNG